MTAKGDQAVGWTVTGGTCMGAPKNNNPWAPPPIVVGQGHSRTAKQEERQREARALCGPCPFEKKRQCARLALDLEYPDGHIWAGVYIPPRSHHRRGGSDPHRTAAFKELELIAGGAW